jgi:hypothetical protein
MRSWSLDPGSRCWMVELWYSLPLRVLRIILSSNWILGALLILTLASRK